MVTLHIPKGVYFCPASDNFYSAKTRHGMGQEFWSEWSHLKHYFPVTAETAHEKEGSS